MICCTLVYYAIKPNDNTILHRKLKNEHLTKHILIYEDVALDDMDQLASAYSVGTIDLTNTNEVRSSIGLQCPQEFAVLVCYIKFLECHSVMHFILFSF